ncbi:YcjF family protein [Prochlorococcus sp. MIT 1341]|uniref:YcjF family protein n=1 Tax=Prochlorococcus sp. MIT 1341 TaxID=3096221 RepID=UPI002A764FF3|nr:YcjF family protein [Prochlorococcus sp. MIT 1341]
MKFLSLPSAPFAPSLNHLGKWALLLGTLLFGQWFFNDVVHIPGGGLGLLFAGAGFWWLSKPLVAKFEAPITIQGWVRKCEEVLKDFEELDEDSSPQQINQRALLLKQITERSGPQDIALVTSIGGSLPEKDSFQKGFAPLSTLTFSWSSPLPLADEAWLWPDELHQKDVVLYFLPLPLRAADLLWLENVPNSQPSWIVVTWKDSEAWSDQLKTLQAQLPHRWTGRVIRLSESEVQDSVQRALLPVRDCLENSKKNLENTKHRLLSKLHSTWQAELENLRRERFRSIQKRTQWMVAGAVFASPVPSTDLLAVAVVNGLMIKEMTKIWSCPWKPEVMQIAARQLAGAAIAQGVVEWSGQALISASKLDGGSWVAAGTLQALNAAYLTRVVGRSMADWLALNSGVEEPDLEALKLKSSELVANAAEKERVDWSAFLKQSRDWLSERAIPLAFNS